MESLVTSLRPRDSLVPIVSKDASVVVMGVQAQTQLSSTFDKQYNTQPVLSAGKDMKDDPAHFPQCQGESQRHESPHLPGCSCTST